MIAGSYWVIPDIIEEPPLIVNSTQFYDIKECTCSTVRDRKNMRILDNSRVITFGNCTTTKCGSGGDNKECTVKIDPDETNKLEKRKNGLYVPPVTWEKLT